MAKLPCFALCLRLALVTLAVGHKKRCVDDYDSLKAGDDCTVRWKELSNGGPFLLPTQPALGYAWVHQLQEEHYSSKKDAEKELKKDRFPVVLGQGNFYLTDRHHHVASLQLSDDKDIFDLEMRIYVICDLRSSGSEIFWSKMQDLNYVFLQKRASPFALPVLARETDLPQSWTLNSFEDDLWRSLAGFASHVSDEKQRCYAKKCQEYFVDFQWGFAINKATEDIPSLWPSMAQQATFRSKLHALPYPSSWANWHCHSATASACSPCRCRQAIPLAFFKDGPPRRCPKIQAATIAAAGPGRKRRTSEISLWSRCLVE